jgi:hypothetical protein
MYKKLIFLSLFLIIPFTLSSAESILLKDYKPKNSDEEAIVSLLNKYEVNWNSGNVQGFLDLWHENAKIMHGGYYYQKRIATKEEFKTIMPKFLEEEKGRSKLGTPKIDISGKEATVNIMDDSVDYMWSYLVTFNLIKENNRWLFMSSKY